MFIRDILKFERESYLFDLVGVCASSFNMKIINSKGVVRFANSGGPPEKEGYLQKRGDLNKGFQRRWFILKGNLLFYYEKRGDKDPIGVIILEGCTIELAECEDMENFAFQITFTGSGVRTYILSADSQDEMEAWMKALSCAPYDYVKIIVAELQSQLKEISETENAKLVEAAERESHILGRTYSDDSSPNKPRIRRPPRLTNSDRINPFDADEKFGDDLGAFRDRTSSSSFSLNVITWQTLGICNFQEMHDEIRRQIKDCSSVLKPKKVLSSDSV